MASFSKGGSFNSYSDYPDHVCRPVIVGHSVGGFTVRAQRVVEVRRSYGIPLNGLVDEYDVHEEWDDDSPREVSDFFNKVHNEASRPTHSTLLSPPKLITVRPSWTSEDHDSPKYREHHDFSGSPLRNKFEGFHLQGSRGSSPYEYKNDGYGHSMDSPKAGHVKDYGVNNTWDSPPRSRLTHDDWDGRRDHDDYGKPKFNGGYKTTSPPLSQATNKPLAPPTYAPKSHFPASYSTPHIKESYPERTQGEKPLASPLSTQSSYYPTSNPITERKESYPEPTKGTKPLSYPVYTKQPYSPTSNYPETTQGPRPLFSPGYTQQSHSPTSNPIPQRKENYPETAHGTKPLFTPGYTQQSHSPTSNPIPQRKESYPETEHGVKPLFSSGYKPQFHSPTSNPTPQRKESYPETEHGVKPLFSSGYKPQSHSPTSNPIPQRKESYPETEHGVKPLFSSGYKPQSHSPTSNPTPQRKESYPETEHGVKPLFSSGYKPQSHSPTSNPIPQRKESYPVTTHDTNPMFSPVSTQQSTENPTSQNNESHPKKKKGWTSLFSSPSKQQPRPPTSHSTPDMKQSYPDHETQGFHPSFTPSSPQKERYSPQMEDHYPDQIQRNASFTSPYENTQEPKQTLNSSEARKKYAHLKPVSPAQMKYSGTIDSKEAVKKYNGAFVP
ncbi:adhesive plaque matrix protein-like [Solanum pennellii]|uniref:Adhesive plaque matrix protein-like n=1 Tax=Solanum pennellii TaxID=28526 RepID=A0ABM1V1W6_SOLPN|nr:adhesive plaque matrix protein-like [Solanum pennellii]